MTAEQNEPNKENGKERAEERAKERVKERLVRVFEAPTITEATVVRSLLRSAGIFAPDFEAAEPFALHDPPEGWHDAEVWVPESQAAEARRVIAEARSQSGAEAGE